MGYIKSVVNTGMEYAEKYRVPEMVSKARNSSTTVDVTVGKLDTLILTPLVAKGTPLVETIDTELDSRVAQATKVVEYAQEKLTENVTEPLTEKTALVKGKVSTTKDYALTRVEETKGKLLEKAQGAVTVSKAQLEVVQTKAISSKAYAEKTLLVGAQEVDKRLGSPYAEKAASYAVKTTDRVLNYSTETAQLLLKKTLAMPLTLKERMDKSSELATEAAGKAKALATDVQSKALVFLLAAKVQLFALPPAVLSTKDGLQASFQNGTISQDAKAYAASALGFAQAKAAYAQQYAQTWLPTAKVAPYLEKAKQGLAVAKAEAAKFQDSAKRSALIEQYLARANSAVASAKGVALRFAGKAKAA